MTAISFTAAGHAPVCVRVVMLEGQAWFATTDVIRKALRLRVREALRRLGQLQPSERRIIDRRSIERVERGNPRLTMVSLAGLPKLIPDRPEFAAFREWAASIQPKEPQ